MLRRIAGLNRNRLLEIRAGAVEALEARHTAGKRPFRAVGDLVSDPQTELDTRLFQRIMAFFWTSPIPQIYRDLFDDGPLLLVDLSKFRRQAEGENPNYAPWHLDANFYGFEVPMLTAWIPLDDVGTDAPGLEFCLPNDVADEAHARDYWARSFFHQNKTKLPSERDLPAMYPGGYRTMSEPLAVGACFVFDQNTAHRTQVLKSATKGRIALEFRVGSVSKSPAGYLGAAGGRMVTVHPAADGNALVVRRMDQMFDDFRTDVAAGRA